MDFNVLSVTALSYLIKNQLETSFSSVKVKGEISNLSAAASGHTYFVLKDSSAMLKSVMWQSVKSTVKLENGMRVICSGKLNIYQARSEYQLVVSGLTYDGVGALMEMFEKRKQQLMSEGLFDESRKKPINLMPSAIGIVTSSTGAVIEDILIRLSARFPCKVIIRDVPVQGAAAAEAVSRAIYAFNASADVDTIIVARGGGSIEDLWAFNEEVVVRAIANSIIPVISAIGHETDTTLADYAADLRAPTPTASVEMATVSRLDMLQYMQSKVCNMRHIVILCINKAQRHIAVMANYIIIFDRKLSAFRRRADLALSTILYLTHNHYKHLQSMLLYPSSASLIRVLEERSKRLEAVNRVISTCSYASTLHRGFAMVYKNNLLITRASQVNTGDQLAISFVDGTVKSFVVGVDDSYSDGK